MNFEHFYELIDKGASNPAGSQRDVLVSQIQFDTSWFDGATYYFEVVAYNSTGAPVTIELRSNDGGTFADTQEATVSVAASTTYTRYRSSSFTPSAGLNVLNVRIPSDAVADTIRLQSARILIVQSSPTKTRLQFPMLLDAYTAYSNLDTDANYVMQKTTMTYATFFACPIYYKDLTYLQTVDSGSSAWTIEVVGCLAAGGPGYVALRQAGTTTYVTGGEISVSALNTPTLYTTSFSNSATNFSDATGYEFAYRSDGTNMFSLQRIALYVKLTGVSAIEVYLRFAARRSAPSAATLGSKRIQLNQNNFSATQTEQYFLQSSHYATDPLHPVVSQRIAAVNSTSSTSGSNITGAYVDTTGTSGTTKLRSRSSAFTPPTNGYDIYSVQELVGTGREVATDFCIVRLVDSSQAVTVTSAVMFGIG